MKKFNAKKFISAALALVMALSLCVPAFAADITTSGGNSEVPVHVTSVGDGLTFKVTMPTAIEIAVTSDGSATVSAATITNKSAGAVQVTGMTIAAASGWAIRDYNSNFNSYAVNTKALGMTVNGLATTGADAIAFSKDAFKNDNAESYMWAGIAGDAVHNTVDLTMAAKLPAQADTLSGETAANIVFTVAWYTGA